MYVMLDHFRQASRTGIIQPTAVYGVTYGPQKSSWCVFHNTFDKCFVLILLNEVQ